MNNGKFKEHLLSTEDQIEFVAQISNKFTRFPYECSEIICQICNNEKFMRFFSIKNKPKAYTVLIYTM